MSNSRSRTLGVHHAGLTVPDLPSARGFFEGALGFEPVGELPDYPAVFLGNGHVMITLWQAERPERAVAFDRRRNIGLHHLALQVESPAALRELARELGDREDVEIEFEPEPLGGGPTEHLMCSVPGGIRLELIAPAKA